MKNKTNDKQVIAELSDLLDNAGLIINDCENTILYQQAKLKKAKITIRVLWAVTIIDAVLWFGYFI